MKKTRVKKLLSAALAAGLVVTSGILPEAPAQVEAAESLPTLTVDMTPDSVRELKHGASGWLYGLGAEGVPSANTMTPLKPHTAVQKAPNGMQHPNGDVLDVAQTFMDAGGQDLQIYVPDYYALWFYEFSSTDEYLDILKMEAEECIAKGIEDEVVYVLYNEPNADWIGGSYKDPETGEVSTGWYSLFWFWEDMYDMVVDVYKENGVASKPRFAGLNLAGYDNWVMEEYIKFCVEHSCMPDVISWHDLGTWQFNNFGNEYNHYRGLEEKYLTPENAEKYGIDITPREIVINEYAAPEECSSPGDLVRWIGLFEEYNVAGCLPFWQLSNNLNGLAAGNNEGNGAWWLYKWYGDMSGQYLPVTTSNTPKDNYYGVASLDNNKRSSNIVFGGVNGASNIVLEDIGSTETFKDADMIHVKLEATDYTGFHGEAEEPRVVKEGAVQVVDGTAVIPLTDMLELSAYRLTITQASEDEVPGFLSTTWKEMYEAENGRLIGNAAVAGADGGLAQSGRQKVGYIDNSSSAVEITVNVPTDGYYKFDMVYTAANGCNTGDPTQNTPYTAIQNLLVDGTQMEQMVLPTTLNWGMGGMYSTYLPLTAGSHAVTVQGTDNVRRADVDCIYLTYKGPGEEDIQFSKTYEAELGEFNELKGADTALSTQRADGVDYVEGLDQIPVTDGGGLRFTAIVSEDGMYTLGLRYSASEDSVINIYQDNDAVHLDNLTASVTAAGTDGEWANVYQTVFLQKGINIIDIDAEGPVLLDYLNVRQADVDPVATVEAESASFTGSAAVGTNSNVTKFASENGYVAGIQAANGVEVIEPGDPDFEIYGRGRTVDLGEAVDKNSMTITVNVPEAGTYEMAVYQSSGELFGRHGYNAQMTERFASFSVNGGEAKKVVFRNTYSDETFRSQVVPVTLQAGENTIKIYNDNSKVITNGIHMGGEKIPANIDYNVLVNYTPNFDKFVFYPVTAEVEVEETESFRISTSYSEGGSVFADKSSAQAGDTVYLRFVPDDNAVLTDARVNGESVMDKLSRFGGIYVVSDVQSDIKAEGYFETSDEGGGETVVSEETYYYSVDCGDINPATLSEGCVLGEYQSSTEQFYGEDPVTGKYWGVVDTPSPQAAYPGWLTGVKTWPCENDGVTDDSPRGKSFRYAKDQPTTDVGIVYQFELEPGETYNLELGFYVPSFWTNESFPRTMKLVLNDNVVVNDNFTASNSSEVPFVIRTAGTADNEGNLKIQIGHADNAVWGPVVSYIDIMGAGDKTELQSEVDRIEAEGYTSDDYSEKTWEIFENAWNNANEILEKDAATQTEIDQAVADLLTAEKGLVDREAHDSLAALIEENQDKTKGITPQEDWDAFCTALETAKFALESDRFTSEDLTETAEKLQNAADRLLYVESVEIAQLPAVTEYHVGDAFDPSGLVVEAVDNKGGRHTLTEEDYVLSGYELDHTGTVTITVTYEGKEATFDVTVLEQQEPEVILKSLEVTKAGKTEYKTGEEFSTEGMEVTVYYTDGSSKVIDAYEVSGFDSETAGQKAVTISYTEDGITVSAVLEVTVTEESGEPTDPSDPSDPSDPGKPGEPSDPSKPGEPSDPGKPSDPADPGNTDDPAAPGGSDDSKAPSSSGQPSQGKGQTGSESVQTGDSTPLFSVFCLAVIGAGTAAAVTVMKKRRHS